MVSNFKEGGIELRVENKKRRHTVRKEREMTLERGIGGSDWLESFEE